MSRHSQSSKSDWGDEACSSDDDDIRMNEEPEHRYLQNVYAQVRLGDRLDDGRYEIVHKLGWGGFSTVWMARDRVEKCDVALKIMTVSEVSENDYEIQDWIKKHMPHQLTGLVVYKDTFHFDGDAGLVHRVLVLPLVGPNLRSTVGQRPMTARRSAARQLLRTLASLHAAGIVMNDINSGGVMWGMQSLSHLNHKQQYEILGRPQKTATMWIEGVHESWGDHVRSMKIPEQCILDTIHLGDFGMAFKHNKPRHNGVAFVTFSAPERIHGFGPSQATDMWSFMLILSELFFGTSIFSSASVAWRLMESLLEYFGPLPVEWEGLYVGDGTIPEMAYGPRHDYPLEFYNAFDSGNLPHLSSEDRSNLQAVLKKGFQYDAERRPTAAQLLEDPAFLALTATDCKEE